MFRIYFRLDAVGTWVRMWADTNPNGVIHPQDCAEYLRSCVINETKAARMAALAGEDWIATEYKMTYEV